MDLGAMVCTRSRPKCDTCPLQAKCQAKKLERVQDFPGSKPKKEKPIKFTYMLLMKHDERVYMYQRPATGIWGGLYSFPEYQSLDEVELELRSFGIAERYEDLEMVEDELFRHTFSHYHLDIQPIVLALERPLERIEQGNSFWMSIPDWQSNTQVGLSSVATQLLNKLAS